MISRYLELNNVILGTANLNLISKISKIDSKISLYINTSRSADLAPKRWQLQTWLIQFWNPLLMEMGIGYVVSRIFHPGKNSEAKYVLFRENSQSGY